MSSLRSGQTSAARGLCSTTLTLIPRSYNIVDGEQFDKFADAYKFCVQFHTHPDDHYTVAVEPEED